MSRIDDDLAQAVAIAAARKPDHAPGDATDESAITPRRRVALLLGLLVICAAVVLLVLSGSRQAAVYSKGIDDLVAQRPDLVGRNVRADGSLVSGTLKRRAQPCEHRFWLEKNGARVLVRYPQCVVPDTFRDLPGARLMVTVEGQLAEDGSFLADRILPKCPSRYDMDRNAADGSRPPHPAGSAR